MMLRAFVAFAIVVVTVGGTARAQDAADVPAEPDDRIERARVAAEEGRFDEARALLRESLELDPRAPTAFNLALVLESTGELVAARALYDQLLAGDFGELPDDRQARASERRTALSSEIASIRITVTGAPRVDVWVDDRLHGEVRASGEALRVDVEPGSHAVRGVRQDGSNATVEVEIGRGEVRPVELSFARPDLNPSAAPATATPMPPVAPPDEGAGDGGVSPWLWAGLGGVVIAGVVVAVVLLAASSTDEPPLPDGFLGSSTALRF